jgi:hypothetical protein
MRRAARRDIPDQGRGEEVGRLSAHPILEEGMDELAKLTARAGAVARPCS